jgi:predicted ATPase
MPATPFVGRQQERTAVESLLDGARLVTLVGPGGTGKTRLAAEVGRQRVDAYPDGVWLVELAGVRDAEQIPSVLQTAFGLRDVDPAAPRVERADRSERERSGYERIMEYLAAKHLLVIIDNCEHLVTASARLADEIVRNCPAVTVLATSREGLGIVGESLWPVPPLRLEESVVLFVERARAAAPSFEASAEAMPVIIEICQRLDGLPLAIELAAARVRTFPLPEILSRIDDRFRLLTGGSRTALPRQQTLRAVVDWSYELLDDDERTTFDRMSVFAETFTLQAAEAVCGDERIDAADIADILSHLVDKSLVQPIHSGLSARYQLLQTLQQYGRERLADSGDAAATRDRHARYYHRLAEEAEPNLRTRAQADWMTLLTLELANFRVALDWAIGTGRAELALVIVGRLSWFWWLSGRPAEGTEWMERAMAASRHPAGSEAAGGGGIDPMIRAEALIWTGFLRSFQGDHAQGLAELAAGTELARRGGRGDLVAVGTGAASSMHAMRGELDVADKLLDESDAEFVAAGDEWGHGVVQLLRASVTLARGELVAARAALEAWMDAFRSSDFGWGLCFALSMLVDVERDSGNYAAAARYADEALDLTARHGYRAYHVASLVYRAELNILQGDMAAARPLIDDALEEAHELAVPWVSVVAHCMAALWDRRSGDLEAAEAHLRTSLAIVTAADVSQMTAVVHVALGYVAEMRGDATGATRHHLAGLEAARQSNSPRVTAQALEGLAGSLSLAGDAIGAARMWGAATRCRAAVRLPLPAEERIDVDRALSRIRAVLDDDAFEAAIDAGATVELDDLLGHVAR